MYLIPKREYMRNKYIITRLSSSLIFYIFCSLSYSCSNIKIERPFDTKIIAHRGFWNRVGATQNSIASIYKTYEIGVDGVEFDVSVTADDSLVVAHGPSHEGLVIAETEFNQLRRIELENSEVIPSLREYLSVLQAFPELVLFIDIKDSHHIYEICQLVSNTITNTCYYLSFSMPVCRTIRAFSPNNNVLYLGNDYSPQELSDYGLTGASYPKETLQEKPEYCSELKTLGLVSSVWTVNGKDELTLWLSQSDVDFITTDTPDIINLYN